MSQAEHPDRLRPDHEVTVNDVRQLMGDESAISVDVQSRIDALLEIQPVDTGGA